MYAGKNLIIKLDFSTIAFGVQKRKIPEKEGKACVIVER